MNDARTAIADLLRDDAGLGCITNAMKSIARELLRGIDGESQQEYLDEHLAPLVRHIEPMIQHPANDSQRRFAARCEQLKNLSIHELVVSQNLQLTPLAVQASSAWLEFARGNPGDPVLGSWCLCQGLALPAPPAGYALRNCLEREWIMLSRSVAGLQNHASAVGLLESLSRLPRQMDCTTSDGVGAVLSGELSTWEPNLQAEFIQILSHSLEQASDSGLRPATELLEHLAGLRPGDYGDPTAVSIACQQSMLPDLQPETRAMILTQLAIFLGRIDGRATDAVAILQAAVGLQEINGGRPASQIRSSLEYTWLSAIEPELQSGYIFAWAMAAVTSPQHSPEYGASILEQYLGLEAPYDYADIASMRSAMRRSPLAIVDPEGQIAFVEMLAGLLEAGVSRPGHSDLLFQALSSFAPTTSGGEN